MILITRGEILGWSFPFNWLLILINLEFDIVPYIHITKVIIMWKKKLSHKNNNAIIANSIQCQQEQASLIDCLICRLLFRAHAFSARFFSLLIFEVWRICKLFQTSYDLQTFSISIGFPALVVKICKLFPYNSTINS